MTAPEAGHRGADGGGGRERLLRGPPPASPGHREGKRIRASARYDTVFTRRSTESNACLSLIETREIIPIARISHQGSSRGGGDGRGYKARDGGPRRRSGHYVEEPDRAQRSRHACIRRRSRSLVRNAGKRATPDRHGRRDYTGGCFGGINLLSSRTPAETPWITKPRRTRRSPDSRCGRT